MNHIKYLLLIITVKFVLGISIIGLIGCQSQPVKAPVQQPVKTIQQVQPVQAKTKTALSVKQTQLAQSEENLIYQPSELGKVTRHVTPLTTTRGRKGGRRRGACTEVSDNFALRLLVPEHTGQTLEEQPTLYWSVSEPLENAQFTFVLNEMPDALSFDFSEPLIHTTFHKSVQAGIQALPLTQILPPAQKDFRLEEGKEYQWFISLICDPKELSLNVTASGSIKRVVPSPKLLTTLEKTPQQALPQLYAKHGIWYNAIDTVSQQIDKHPNVQAPRQIRARLLKQVGLPEVAIYDMQME